MKVLTMFDVDVRLLQLFQAIFRNGSVSKAAIKLNIGQPAASIGLNKLRSHFSNQLFVRVGNRMEATDIAKELAPMIDEALEQIRAVNEYRKAFNPAVSSQEFSLSMTDISHLQMIPKLVEYLKHHAPHIRINVVPINSNLPGLMSTGEVDLAIGFIPQLEAGFYQQTLFKQHYVALVSKYHPRIQGDELSVEAYLNENHIEIVPHGTGHYLVESELRKMGLKRNVVVKLPSYLGVGLVIQETELIATIPERLSHLLLSRGHIKALPLPYDLPTYSVKQHWHERMHNSPENQWLRQVCFQLFHIGNHHSVL